MSVSALCFASLNKARLRASRSAVKARGDAGGLSRQQLTLTLIGSEASESRRTLPRRGGACATDQSNTRSPYSPRKTRERIIPHMEQHYRRLQRQHGALRLAFLAR